MTRIPELRRTLRDADEQYDMLIHAGEHPNVDRVGYTSITSLDRLRHLLGRPDLESDELASIMRAALQEIAKGRISGIALELDHDDQIIDVIVATETSKRTIDARVPRPIQAPNPDQDWTTLMARMMMANVNENVDS
jgi:hypothetical protein